MWPNLQETADLVTFTQETLNGKLHFLSSVNLIALTKRLKLFLLQMFTFLFYNYGKIFLNYQVRMADTLSVFIREPKFQWPSRLLVKQWFWASNNFYIILSCLPKWALVFLKIKIYKERKKVIFPIFSVMKFFEHNYFKPIN